MAALSFLGLGGRERPALQLYGKLPVAKDFLRVGCADGGARDWRDRLDRTFGSLHAGGDEYALREPLRFFGLDAKEPLQGCLWPSTDAGGLRRFPFTLLVERRRKALQTDCGAGLTQAEAVWCALIADYERCLAAADGRAVLEPRRSATVEVEELEPTSAAYVDCASWVRSLWPSEEERGLREIAAGLVGAARAKERGPFRLPLVRDVPLRDQVGAWLTLLERCDVVERGDVPTTFLPFAPIVRSSEAAHVIVIARALVDEDLRWLVSNEDERLGPGDFAVSNASRSDSDESAASGSAPLGPAVLDLLAGLPGLRS